MNNLVGTHFDGRHPVGSAATLLWLNQEASLIGAQVSAKYSIKQIRVSPRIGTANRFVSFPDGSQLQCEDTPLLDALPQQSTTEGIVAWLERRWIVAVIGVIAVFAILGVGYAYGLPRLAEYAAKRIPIEAERDLGNTTLTWLDGNGWFAPSTLCSTLQQDLRADFAAIVKGLPHESDYRLEFRDAPRMGANALALPGGTIVITDAMVKLTNSSEEALSVLAHESGHVELRHTMRQALQGSGIAAAVTALTGDAASLSTAVAGLPVMLAQASYSREFESEADDFAFKLLKQNHISPVHFADLMERLDKNQKGSKLNMSFLASHPLTLVRIQRARAAGAGLYFGTDLTQGAATWPMSSIAADCPPLGGSSPSTP